MTNTSLTANRGGLQTVRNLLCHVRVFTKLKTNLKLFKLHQNDLNLLLDVITILSEQLDSRLQKDHGAGDGTQHVGVVAICRFHGLRTCPESPLKSLIPLVREMAKLRVVIEVTIRFSYTEYKTITRIHLGPSYRTKNSHHSH